MFLAIANTVVFVLLLQVSSTTAQTSSGPLPTTFSSVTIPLTSLTLSEEPLPTNSQATASYVQPVKPAYSNVYRYQKNCDAEEAKLEGMIWEDQR